ncbi:MAG TPA: winged helix-turn-helix domain-containing protein [Candidatus Acidoferrum sp.]|jgi:Tol biopolymer transport system component/DNA-binding winged helix-turn-helix (wHTH) protein
MDQVSGSARVVRFGEFGADLQTGELRKNGVKVPLQGQPFQVCAILLSHPGKLVSREELRQKVWPEDTFVDFDQALNTAIGKIRIALGDDADNPRFVETLPRRGYRFIGAVDEQRVVSPLVADRRYVREFGSRARWTSVVGAFLVVSFGLAVWRLHRSRLETPPPAIEVVPLVGSQGFESEPVFSPDGNHVAFAIHKSKNFEKPGIYTTVVGGERALRLTTDMFDCCPTWSSDGRLIAFSRRFEDGFDIYVVPALGGIEHRLSSWPREGHPTSDLPSWRAAARCFDWSPDGKLVAFSSNQADQTHGWIGLLSLADSQIRPLTSPPSQNIDYTPAFSPDGKTVAFVRGIAAGVVQDIYLVPVAGGTPTRLTFDNTWIAGAPAWTADGRDIVFSSTRGGAISLWRISVSGGQPRPIPGIGANAVLPSISPSGDQLVYQLNSPIEIDLWMLGLKDKKHLGVAPIRRIVQKGGIARPQFSPDGKRIAFESMRSGYPEIWTCDSDGSNCGQITSLRGTAGAVQWSPDGRFIAFEFRPKEHSEIYLLEIGNGIPRILTTLPGADNGGPNWSRDGQWIYFYSDRGGGPFQLWKIRQEGGTPVQVTRNGGVFATESDDGRFLYYSKFEVPGLWKAPLAGGDEIRILDQPRGEYWSNWVLVHDGIYFLDQPQKKATAAVAFLEFATGRKMPIAQVGSACCGLTLSPDGTSVFYAQVDDGDARSDLMLVKNFR